MADKDKEREKSQENGEKVSIEDSAFEALEKEFQEILVELMGDKSLEKYRTEYEKLHKALKKSHDSEKRLMQKCRELNAEIVANSAKVATALKLSQEDQQKIASLKKEIESAWKSIDNAHAKETRAKETIDQLKSEIANLSKLVEQGAGLTMGQEHNVNELLKVKTDLTKERDQLFEEVTKCRDQLTKAQERQIQLESSKKEAQEKLVEVNQEITLKNNEAQKEARKKDKLERDIRQLRVDYENKTDEAEKLSSQLKKSREDISKFEQELKRQTQLYETAKKELDITQERLRKAQTDFEVQIGLVDQLASQNQERVGELKGKEEEVNHIRTDLGKRTAECDKLQKRVKILELSKADAESHRDTLKTELAVIEKELLETKRANERDRKGLETLTRERDLANKTLIKATDETAKQKGLVDLHMKSKENLEKEIANYKEEAAKQRKIIYQLEKERDRYINEAGELTQKVLLQMEDVKRREMQIFDYKKKIAESETKLKQQQNLYEAVRSDRNLYSKNLIESQDEITEMKRKLKIMNHQIDQLKEEISSKEQALVKEHADWQQVEKERDGLKAELQKMKAEAEQRRAYIEDQEREQRKLLKRISEADAERLRQKKELDQVISERDILGTQLVRRNDELALLYEKIKLQQSVLNKGENQYNQRLEDVRILKLEIKKLRREKHILQKSAQHVDDLKKEVYHLQRELLRERTRCKALEEELENPMNVHRWRRLEGNDPSSFELIQKVHALQKRLISKTEEVVERELQIQEKEKLYVELKHILARQPGPEVSEQLISYQQTLKEKTKQMKSLASELNMAESQAAESKFEIERLDKELQGLKRKYFAMKRREQQVRESEMNLARAGLPPILPQRSANQTNSGRVFVGGGFSLNQPAPAVAAESAKA